jgi:apolipoprotein D and lipocalin family protein
VGASATYEKVGDKLRVTNRCLDASGKQIGEAKGTVKLAKPNDTSKLNVSFFWPFYGDYWVLMLADDYRYSVVGDPKRKYFWILARETSLDAADTQTILERMPALGYDPKKLYWTRFP